MSLVLLNLQSNQLIKLDSQNPITIGRGNVDGCFDKRVSRNHGRITCTLDGKIRLVALHSNPCFFTRNGVPPVLQLNKGEEEILSEGDCLGLLPNAFWFQIKLNSEIKVKEEPKETDPKNVKINNDDNIVNGTLTENGFSAVDIVVHENLECMPNENKDSLNSFSIPSPENESVSDSAGTSKTFSSPEFEKTRRLPLWMYEIDDAIESHKSPNKHKLKSNQDAQNKRQRIISEIKKKPKLKTENGIQLENAPGVANTASTSKQKNYIDRSDFVSSTQIGSVSAAQVEGESSNGTHKEGYEIDVNNEVETPPRRSICQYEGNCYRKNPQHKLEFCHPGDADYIPYEERPACQYGAACYRRNERHRIEYKHSVPSSSSHVSPPTCSRTSLASSPLPVKRRREIVKKQNSEYDDEYDLEDPFINDASSDEYIPSEWDSEEEEVENFDTSQEEGER